MNLWNNSDKPRQVLLAGAGPANLFIVTQAKRFLRQGLVLTLIDESLFWFNSNMAAEVLGGQYGLKDFRLDLRKFCQHFGVEFIQDQAVAILPEQKQLMTASNRLLHYDWIAFALGAIPREEPGDVPAESSFPVLPVRQVLEIRNEVETLLELFPQKKIEIAIVGGGSTGVSYAMQIAELMQERKPAAGSKIVLLEKQPRVLAAWPKAASQRAEAMLKLYDIEARTKVEVQHIQSNRLVLEKGETLETDLTIVAQGSRGHELFNRAGLDTDATNTLRVEPGLHTSGYKEIFASGRCAALSGSHPIASPQQAWQMGKILAHNLLASSRKDPLIFYPAYQSQRLRFLSLGKTEALLIWGQKVFYGQWVLRLKQWLDKRWMKKMQRPASA
jgi:selenide, water dikinase